MIYWQLFIGFLQVGCFAFGGAYGAIPLIRDVVLANGWLTEEKLTYMIAVSESTPGPIMVNLATYVGSSQAGLLGALISTLAVVLPSFFVILLIMVLLKTILQQPWMQAVLRGVKPCMAGIILATGIYMVCSHCVSFGEHLELDMHSFLITLLLAFAMLGSGFLFRKKLSPIRLIALSAGLGIIVYGICPSYSKVTSSNLRKMIPCSSSVRSA